MRSKSRPQKPHKDFPLFPHTNGKWCKKVLGRHRYFGNWHGDPQGMAALEKRLDQKDDLLAGRTLQENVDGLTIRILCNTFLFYKDNQLEAGEIVRQTRVDYQATAERVVRVFGKTKLVEDLKPSDFGSLRKDISKTRGPVALANEITRVRGLFNFAFQNH